MDVNTSTTVVSYETFDKICLTIGRAVKVVPNPSAKVPAYLLQLDMGSALTEEHFRISNKAYYTSSAQLCSNHAPEDIIDHYILSVINFPRKQIGKMMSDCLVTGVQMDKGSSEEKRETTVFMTTSTPVDEGSRVGILAKKERLEKNPRDLLWPDFTLLDLRIGTIEACESSMEISNNINQVITRLNLGELGKQQCIGLLSKEVDISSLMGKQVLVLTNLSKAAKKELFGREETGSVLCTIDGLAVLEPAKPVDNGFKLA